MITAKHSAPAPPPDHDRHSTPRHAMLFIGLCVLLTLAGCIPERQWKVPRISGTVKTNGQPAGGVKVLITRTDNSCNEPVSVATTDAQGKFSYEGISEFGVGRIFVSSTQTFSICLQSGGSPVLGYSQRFGGYSHAAINCELEQKTAPTQPRLCTITGMN